MTTQLSVTTAQRIAAQREAYRFYLVRDKWGEGDTTSIHLLPPMALAAIYEELATLDRIRAHFQHGADESLWPPGTPLDVAVGRLVAERNALLARLEEIDDEAKFKKHMRERRHEQINPPMTSDKA